MDVTPSIPDKAQFRVNEVCQLTDTQPYVLRFWESEFPQLAGGKGKGGSRVYDRDEVELIFRIKHLLYEKEYTIAGARRLLEGDEPAEEVVFDEPQPIEAQPEPEIEAAPEPVQQSLELPEEPEDEIPSRPTLVATQPEPAGGDNGISRARYEDALEEISHLRLRLTDAEAQLRKALSDGTDWKQKSERAALQIESILERLQAERPA